MKMWKVLEKAIVDITEEQFWKATTIWNSNPHVVNRRIFSSVVLLTADLEQDFTISDSSTLSSIQSLMIQDPEPSVDELFGLLQAAGLKILVNTGESEKQLFLKKHLPRNSDHFKTMFELVILDKIACDAVFIKLGNDVGASLIPPFPYKLCLKSNVMSLEVTSNQDILDPSAAWLQSQLYPTLQKWALATDSKKSSEVSQATGGKTHTLVSAEKYNDLYQSLKKKYGQEMVKIWPECTDPVKFVYEDVAIASYILLLWEGKGPVNFVDLGCGNGLLVHILNSEGHNGRGIDVRSRKIWQLYPATTKLEVCSITPSDSALFPDADWLIGNHSDELTPWVPVIAARSSLKCKFFLLPCCPYDFDGQKYRRKNSNVSQYSDFLDYVQDVSEQCGFKTYVDRLRIPSTKRVCLIGQERKYAQEKWSQINATINTLIENGCRKLIKPEESLSSTELGKCDNGNGWVSDFKPRESKEKVRNCTQLEKSLIEEIVTLATDHLLAKRRPVPSQRIPGQTWNAGGTAAISEFVPLIGGEKLKRLKSECGGLQTLLKNNHQVFSVVSGKVQLRSPIRLSDVTSNKVRTKYKPCWFHSNHPDGCLLNDEECAFQH